MKKDTVLHGFVVDTNYMEHEYPEFLILEKSQTMFSSNSCEYRIYLININIRIFSIYPFSYRVERFEE